VGEARTDLVFSLPLIRRTGSLSGGSVTPKSVVGYFEFNGFISRKTLSEMKAAKLHAAINTENPQIEPIQIQTRLEDANRLYNPRQTATPIVRPGF
jgi:hypothetical protein